MAPSAPASSCPFCYPAGERVFHRGELVLGLWDAFPVTPGHALLVPHRHVTSWFEATDEERRALTDAVVIARDAILATHQPDGFNIGVNIGAAAGQTVEHLHLHVIPRDSGDVSDPRGGVRHVLPAKANYLEPSEPRPDDLLIGMDERPPRTPLVTGGAADPLLPRLATELATAAAIDIAVAFVLPRGVVRLASHLEDMLGRGGRLRLVTGDYRDVTDPDALLQLMDLPGSVELRVFETNAATAAAPSGRAFHPKAYVICRPDGGGVAFVGSSNLSEQALTHAVEWNYRVVSREAGDGWAAITSAFDRLWSHEATRPLTKPWIEAYRARRAVVAPGGAPLPQVEVAEEPVLIPIPHDIQHEALEALEQTRLAGHTAGLVVLATGLGKTWLSAFDTSRPEFRRVLFVAHREEILHQALRTFRATRPAAQLGLYMGDTQDDAADVLFASIQTLSRAAHLQRFDPATFDYIVVDEFHHAAAATYRRLIDYFRPRFLLGLTATPERSDGGDLLSLCQENLVFRCDLAEGIRRELLCPFRYVGVPDLVDYTNIPWRSTRFDEEALTAAVATQARAENALEQWRRHAGPGSRTIAFCVSRRHARFMAEFFGDRGLRAVAVHSGPDSAPRALSLERLARQELDIVCAVDMFNEGVDLPQLDTVLMLRPTESRVLWLQQLGRGLRKAHGKSHLRVIDYIGNHTVFLLKPQTLFDLPAGRQHVYHCLEKLQAGEWELPPGCEITYELEAIEILKALSQPPGSQDQVLRRYYEDFRDLHGVRPTASEAHHDGYKPRSVRPRHGSWLGFVREMGDLDVDEATAAAAHPAFLEALEATEMTRSYKMLVLKAMLDADAFPGSMTIGALTEAVFDLASRTPIYAADLGAAYGDAGKLRALLEKNPVAAWTGGKGTGGRAYFGYDTGMFHTTVGVADAQRAALQRLVREVVEWRLVEYLDRAPAPSSADEAEYRCGVSHATGRPMVFLPDRARHPDLPDGPTPVLVDGVAYEAMFARVAVNVLRRTSDGQNELPAVLRRWFGPDAGLPGTRHAVLLKKEGSQWLLLPDAHRRDAVMAWKSYSREEIPPLFGMEFSTAVWNVGYVARNGHIFLLVTLDKTGHGQEFQYGDHFISPVVFKWQSQNRTSQESTDGRRLGRHVEDAVPVHLFVRRAKKTAGGGAAPFIYCGDVQFVDWEGSRPITIRWRLPEAVPERLRDVLKVPGDGEHA